MTSPDDARTGGFTLLELLVVIAILGLAFAIFGGVGRPPGERSKVQFAARELAEALRGARAQAVVENRRLAVTFDLGAGAWRVGSGAWQALPRGVRTSLLTGRSEVRAGSVASISFWPDGSSSGGRLTLAGPAVTTSVGIDWLSGKVSVAEDR